MSVLLSSTVCYLYSISYYANQALQVGCFWHVYQNWMVLGLAPALQKPNVSMNIAGGFAQNREEVGRTYVIGAGASDQNAARSQHLERPKVEFFVAAHGRIEVFLALGESRRIENDGVILPACA